MAWTIDGKKPEHNSARGNWHRRDEINSEYVREEGPEGQALTLNREYAYELRTLSMPMFRRRARRQYKLDDSTYALDKRREEFKSE